MKIFTTSLCTAGLLLLITFLMPANTCAQTNQNDTTAHSDTMVETAPPVTGITQGRAKSLGIGALGLIALVIAFMANKRSSRTPAPSQARVLAITALLMAVACVVLSATHIYYASGAFGTGTGKAGSIASLIVAVIAIIISLLALRKKSL